MSIFQKAYKNEIWLWHIGAKRPGTERVNKRSKFGAGVSAMVVPLE
jgi:hypothetical protein